MEHEFDVEENWGTNSDQQSLIKSLSDMECITLFEVCTPPIDISRLI
jgi:hypothetical protein